MWLDKIALLNFKKNLTMNKTVILFFLALLLFSCKESKDNLNDDSTKKVASIQTKLNPNQIGYMESFFEIKERSWIGYFSIIEFKKEGNSIVQYEYLENLKVDKRKMELKIMNDDTIFSIPKKGKSFQVTKDGDLKVYENKKLVYLLEKNK